MLLWCMTTHQNSTGRRTVAHANSGQSFRLDGRSEFESDQPDVLGVYERADAFLGFQGFELGAGDTTGGYGMGGAPGVGWVNNVTGMGTDRDKTAYGKYAGYSPVDLITLANLYHGDDLSARIIDTPVNEVFRLPYKVSVGSDRLDKEILEDLQRLSVRDRFVDSYRWGQLFGGAWTVYGADDGRPASEPLNPRALRRGVEWLQVVDRRFMWPISWYQDGPKAGTPDKYVLSQNWVGVAAGAYVIHESRMIRWPGVPTGQRERNLNASYDFSALDRAWPHIRMYNTLWKGVELLITEGPQAVYKVKGLAKALMADRGKDLRKRFAIADYYRSVVRAVLIDSDSEEFERQQLQLAGVPDVLNQAAFRVASTAQIPTMVLFGQDPSGLNATGESSLRWFWDRIRAKQENEAGPRLKELVRILLLAKGADRYINKVQVDWEPLHSPTALEKAQTVAAQAQADAAYVTAQVVTPEEVALSRFQDRGIWSPDWTAVDRDTREKMLADVMANLATGAEPGAPEVGSVGRTPQPIDVRGFAMPEQPVEVVPSQVPPASSGAQSQHTPDFRPKP